MSSTPSSRRRTTWCFLCIENDGIVGKFSARQHAYDLEATMWVPRSATADWPADDCIGISVLDCL